MARFVDRCVDCFGLLRLHTSAPPETRLWATVRRQPVRLMYHTLIGGLRLNAAQHSLVHWRPEATLVKDMKRVLFRVPDSVDPEEVLVAHPTFDIWSLGVISFMALARRSLPGP